MKKTLAAIAALLIAAAVSPDSSAQKTKQNYVIGFYNLENLFDIYDDPVKNDQEYLPEGKNKWTQAKYEKKLWIWSTPSPVSCTTSEVRARCAYEGPRRSILR